MKEGCISFNSGSFVVVVEKDFVKFYLGRLGDAGMLVLRNYMYGAFKKRVQRNKGFGIRALGVEVEGLWAKPWPLSPTSTSDSFRRERAPNRTA